MQNSCAEGLVLSYLSGFGAFFDWLMDNIFCYISRVKHLSVV